MKSWHLFLLVVAMGIITAFVLADQCQNVNIEGYMCKNKGGGLQDIQLAQCPGYIRVDFDHEIPRQQEGCFY